MSLPVERRRGGRDEEMTNGEPENADDRTEQERESEGIAERTSRAPVSIEVRAPGSSLRMDARCSFFQLHEFTCITCASHSLSLRIITAVHSLAYQYKINTHGTTFGREEGGLLRILKSCFLSRWRCPEILGRGDSSSRARRGHREPRSRAKISRTLLRSGSFGFGVWVRYGYPYK